MTAAKKSIYARLADARKVFHSMELKKTGWNSYSRYAFFEMADFLIPAMNCLRDEGLVPVVTFLDVEALMIVHTVDTEETIHVSSPNVNARYQIVNENIRIEVEQALHLKGCHPIQNLGATESYQRRYLWTTLMEIVEHDQVDSSDHANDTKGEAQKPAAAPKKTAPKKAPAKKAAPKKAAPKKAAPKKSAPEAQKDFNDNGALPEINDAQGARDVADMLINLATGSASSDMKALAGFWRTNKQTIDLLDNQYPDEYARLKAAFTELRTKLEVAK